MHISTPRTEDARAIAEVHVAAWQRAYRDLLPAEYLATLSVAQREKMWSDTIAKGKPEVLVATVDDAIVGFIAFGPSGGNDDAPDASEVWAMYAAPNVWSSGVGRALWLASRERMREQGVRSVSLWVFADNGRATAFYRAAGFTPDSGSAKEVAIGGVLAKEMRYVQDLSATA